MNIDSADNLETDLRFLAGKLRQVLISLGDDSIHAWNPRDENEVLNAPTDTFFVARLKTGEEIVCYAYFRDGQFKYYAMEYNVNVTSLVTHYRLMLPSEFRFIQENIGEEVYDECNADFSKAPAFRSRFFPEGDS